MLRERERQEFVAPTDQSAAATDELLQREQTRRFFAAIFAVVFAVLVAASGTYIYKI